MDEGSIRLILIFAVLVLFSALFSCMESAISLINKIRVRQRAEDGDKRAKSALYVVNHFEKALTTLLILINLTHIAAAAVATLLVGRVFDGSSEGTVNAISTFGATAVIFLLGEMIPKTLANDRSESLSMALSPLLCFLMKLFTPLSAFFTGIAHLSTKLFKAEETPSITEDELIDIIDTAEEEGVMDEEQSDLLKSAMQFSGTTVDNVMTARDAIVAIPVTMSHKELLDVIQNSNHSRLPVYQGDIDHIIGYLQTRSFLREYLKGGEIDLRSLLIPAFFVRPGALIDDLLTIMRQHKFYMAVVSEDDESGVGRTLGIVTIEDFLEELVGDIWDESDEIDPNFSKLGGNRYRIDTHMPVGEAFARMNCPPPESRVAKMPLLAWVIETFRHIPDEEESFTYRNMEVTVDTVDGHRVSYVVIQLDTGTARAQSADVPAEATVTEADLPAPMADEGALSKEVSV
ncbi:MAG: hemolysin family protein [Clostridia bacterium]|nr:hemolysin family protein [Clostridia bacterium]